MLGRTIYDEAQRKIKSVTLWESSSDVVTYECGLTGTRLPPTFSHWTHEFHRSEKIQQHACSRKTGDRILDDGVAESCPVSAGLASKHVVPDRAT